MKPSVLLFFLISLLLWANGVLWGLSPLSHAQTPGQRTLALGNWGEDVFWLQRKLMDLGFMDVATGQYGAITKNAVSELQRAYGLKVDGIAGPETLSVLGTAQGFHYYTVEKGDSLYTIAKRFGISMDELVNLNALQSTTLQIGQRLRVPRQAKALTHKVVPGDNLYNIAKAYNVTVSQITALNKITDPAFIKPGQELVIPPAH